MEPHAPVYEVQPHFVRQFLPQALQRLRPDLAVVQEPLRRDELEQQYFQLVLRPLERSQQQLAELAPQRQPRTPELLAVLEQDPLHLLEQWLGQWPYPLALAVGQASFAFWWHLQHVRKLQEPDGA